MQGKYGIIYVDPPWDYGKPQHNGKVGTGSAETHYDVMSIKDIANMNVEGLAARDCLLFMWTTGPQLENSIKVLRAWGFDYKQVAFTWDKFKVNPGSYTMTQFEFVLVGKRKRGKIPQPRGIRNARQSVGQMRAAHSVKPDQIAERIEQMFPHHPKIELFARRQRDGWTCWGNELSDLEHYEPIRKVLFNNESV